jgi:hypothetical protein
MLLALAGCVAPADATKQPKPTVPVRAMSYLEPGQSCEAFGELDVWVFRADRARWTVDEIASGLPILKSGISLEVVEDAGDVGEWKGEYRLIRVRAHSLSIKHLDTRDGHFAPGEYVDHEFCVQRRDLRVRPEPPATP